MKSSRKKWIILGIVVGIPVVILLSIYLVIKLWILQPTGEALSLPEVSLGTQVFNPAQAPVEELNTIRTAYYQQRDTAVFGENFGNKSSNPICGNQKEMLILAAAIDYRGSDYLYGLADVVRVVRVDFTVPQANVVSLPRAMLVYAPQERLQVENPILLNQAYFFGTPGMGYYAGSGYGAGSLAETIQYNLGVSVDHYVVVDFNGFVKFVDAMGGVEVDLPEPVDDLPANYFPAGKQVLNGEQALALARIRNKYSDFKRIDNQTLILQAVFERLKQPAVWIRVPELVGIVKESIITDVPSNQLEDLICIFQRLDKSDIFFADNPEEHMAVDWEYIPSMQQEMQIIRWDASFARWFYENIWHLAQ